MPKPGRPSKVEGPPRKVAGLEVTVEDDLAGLTDEQIAREQKLFTERAERVRRRLTMNQAFLPPQHPARPQKD